MLRDRVLRLQPGRRRPRTSGRWQLRTKLLVALTPMGVVPFAVVAWLAVTRVAETDVNAAGARVEAAAVDTGEIIDRNLFERFGDVQAFAASPAVRDEPRSAQEVTDTFTTLYGVYDLMVVTDASGIVVAANTVDHLGESVPTEQLLGRDVSATPWFQAAVGGGVDPGDTYYEQPSTSELATLVYGDDRLILPFSAAILGPDGELVGVWRNEASFDRIVGDITSATRDDLAAAGIDDVNVEIVADGRRISTLDPTTTTDGAVPAGTSGSRGNLGATGRSGERIVGYGVTDGALGFAGYDWTVIVSQDRAAVSSHSGDLGRFLAVLGVITAGIIAGLSYLLARQLSGPVGLAVTGAANAARDLKAMSGELSRRSGETSDRASTVTVAGQQLNTGVMTISSALNELTASFAEVSRNAQDANGAANEAVEVARASADATERLTSSSEAIDTVVEVIRALAKQTNLLALNATIEAARAGQAGTGFAVVANSVKQLATETDEATQRISDIVQALKVEARSAIGASTDMSGAIERILEYSASIAAATEQQTTTVAELSRVTSAAARDAEEIALSNASLADNVEQNQEAARSTENLADLIADVAGDLRSLVFGSRDRTATGSDHW